MTTDNDNLGFGEPPNLEPENPNEDIVNVDDNDSGDESSESSDDKKQEAVTLTLDPNDISGSLDRLMRDEPKVLNVVNTLIGNKARTKYNPRIQELEAELESIRGVQQRSKFEQIPQDELPERMKDPDFARQYSDAMSSEEVLQAKRQAAAVSRRIGSIIDNAQDAGLSTQGANSIFERLQKGEFDHAEDGSPIMDVETAIGNLNSAIYKEMLNQGATPAGSNLDTNNSSSPDASVSDALDESTPDVSQGGSGTRTGGPTFSIDDINKMDPLTFETHFPNDDDYTNAIKEGRITGLSTEARSAIA